MENEHVLYLCPKAPMMVVKVGMKKFKAVDGVLKLPVAHEAEMDGLMKSRADLRHALKKVDIAAAMRQVQNHKAQQGRAAVAGPFASDNGPKAVLRNAAQAQKNENLVGSSAPVNTAAQPKAEPMKVQEINTGTPAVGALSRFANKG